MVAFTKSWKELSGEHHWENLLDPLDEDLREYIIHYGERSQAICDGCNGEAVSANYGKNRCAKDKLFFRVGLDYSPYKYEVTEYVFKTDANNKGTWVGYVAVTTDEGVKALGRRDILVVWRGTSTQLEALYDCDDGLVRNEDIINGANGDDAMVHAGWNRIYNDVKQTVRVEVKRLVNLCKGEEFSITVAGHSMGAALATLNAVDLCCNHYNKPTDDFNSGGCLVTVFAYASPKVGNEPFKDFVNGLDELRCLRIVNGVDVALQLPPLRCYHNVGEQLMVDSRQSTWLKGIAEAGIGDFIVTAHQLETYLHLVAGTQGIGKPFDLKDRRDISLVNKDGDNLAASVSKEKRIPASWWVVKEKAMAQQDDGSWVLKDDSDDDHDDDFD